MTLESILSKKTEKFLKEIKCDFCGSRDFDKKTVEYWENTYSCKNCLNSKTVIFQSTVEDFKYHKNIS